jgi:DNA gyrase subunit A
MHELNLKPGGGYRKCARVVGEVLGKFHPHGDLSVYDALVRMAQDFVMSAPLVAGHGNFGSLDNDPPAAMRYTECKLSQLAASALLADLDSDTVDFAPNFDGNEVEPVVLPARLPVLLLNGATGIAVGMATNVPPHNLGELVRALDAFLAAKLQTCDNKAAAEAVAAAGGAVSTGEDGNGEAAAVAEVSVSDAELFRLIPGPDFPTGGVVLGRGGARAMYQTGHGSVALRALAAVEEVSARTASGKVTTRTAVVVREVPYGCNKVHRQQTPQGQQQRRRLRSLTRRRRCCRVSCCTSHVRFFSVLLLFLLLLRTMVAACLTSRGRHCRRRFWSASRSW